MAPFLFGVRNGVHIIDLEQTVPLLHQSLVAVRDIVAAGGRVLFVGTKRQASELLADSAKRCGQYYVNHRWLGGMMTNWKTISNSIKRLQVLEDQLAKEDIGLTKKELLNLTRERDKLDRALGGIKEMGGLPDVLVVIDTNKEHIAVKEAVILGIPVVGVVDSNSDPEGVTYPVPGNDDATRAIRLYCDLLADAVLDGGRGGPGGRTGRQDFDGRTSRRGTGRQTGHHGGVEPRCRKDGDGGFQNGRGPGCSRDRGRRGTGIRHRREGRGPGCRGDREGRRGAGIRHRRDGRGTGCRGTREG
jgi:small subunit ribosomal protein S2